jgi:hypothetical protein
VIARSVRKHYGQRDGEEHESDCGIRRHLGEQAGRAARTEGGLRALAAECSGEIGGLSLLKQDNAYQKEANNYMKYNNQINHRMVLNLLLKNKLEGANSISHALSLSRTAA